MGAATASTTLPAVRGIERTSAGFKRELLRVAERLGIDAGSLAAVISFETAGTFSPSEKNPSSGATGLIQFMPGKGGSAELLGTTTTALAAMSAEAQLKYVEEFYRRVLGGRRVSTVRDTYLVVIAPKYVLSPPGTVIYDKARDGKNYTGNIRLDADGDGRITAEEAAAPVEAILRQALARPPIVVPPAATGDETAAAVLLGLATVAVFLYNARTARINGQV